MQLNHTITVLARIGLAGSTVLVIAAFFLAGTPDARGVDVAPADADVFFGAHDSSHTRFGRVIESSGLRVRPYDMNGNVVYFASGQTRKRPAEALDYYQRAFVREGLNSRNWASHPTRAEAHAASASVQIQELSDATLRGEVVPEVRAPNYVTMTSLAVSEGVSTRSDFIESGSGPDGFDFVRAAGGFRMIEAAWDADVSRTQITAVWSAPEFDAEAMDNRAYLQSPPDTDLPACAGCTREVAFKSLDPGEPLRSDSYRTASSVAATHTFYANTLARQGWEPSGVHQKLDWLAAQLPDEPGLGAGKLLDLRHRDGRSATIAVVADGSGARVMTMRD